MRIRTFEAVVVSDVLTGLRDTCEAFVSAMTRVCVRYRDVLHVCMNTVLDSKTVAFADLVPYNYFQRLLFLEY